MPDPIPCPACETKIILNGDIAAKVLNAICERIEAHVAAGKTFPDPLTLVQMANKLGDDSFKFAKEVLKQMGFQGPWPHSMS